MTAYLFDTHLLLWAAADSPRLPHRAAALMNEPASRRLFSALSIAEVSIKHARGRPDFEVDPKLFRQALLDNEYEELSLTSLHAVMLDSMPRLHRDPFDRLMIAQAASDGITFVTMDRLLEGYGGWVKVL